MGGIALLGLKTDSGHLIKDSLHCCSPKPYETAMGKNKGSAAGN